MLGVPALAVLLLQLAARSSALSALQSLGPVQEGDTSGKKVGKRGFLIFDTDDDNDWEEAADDEGADELVKDGSAEQDEEGGTGDDFITDVEGPFQPTKHHSDEERKMLHKKEFEEEFIAKLNITRSRETGELVGLLLGMPVNFTPPVIQKVKKWGLSEDWNALQRSEGHPEQQLKVGDEIYKVNDISWHHNSLIFAKRISDQFLAVRHHNSRATLDLYVRRRTRDESETRTAYQRAFRHKYLYVKEWSPQMETITVPKGLSLSDTMGWTLHYDDYYRPVKITGISNHGLVAFWNKANPKDKMVVGDELVEIDGYWWNQTHDSRIFLKRLDDKVHHLIEYRKTLKLGIRRPREVQQALGEATPDKEQKEEGDVVVGGESEEGELGKTEKPRQVEGAEKAEKAVAADGERLRGASGNAEREETAAKANQEVEEISCSKTFLAKLRASEGSKEWDNFFMGWHLTPEGAAVKIDRIQGAVAEWNAKNSEQILSGDEILSVNNVGWSGDAVAFMEGIHNASKTKFEFSKSLSVELKRRWKEKRTKAQGYAEKVASVRLKIEGLASAWHNLPSKDVVSMASKVFTRALEASVAKSTSSA